jgi:hypothetical protein
MLDGLARHRSGDLPHATESNLVLAGLEDSISMKLKKGLLSSRE